MILTGQARSGATERSIRLQRVNARDDESAWGHLARILLVSGLNTRFDLRKLGQSSSNLFPVLAKSAGLGLFDYVDNHGVTILLHAVARSTSAVNRSTKPLTQGGPGGNRNIFPRACPTCVQEDSIKLGYSWYRRRHNLAGIATCYLHGDRLRIVGTANEREQGESSLALLRDRINAASRLARRDEFVARYEIALLMLCQKRATYGVWRSLVSLCVERDSSFEFGVHAPDLANRVLHSAGEDWLPQNFECDQSRLGNIIGGLAKVFASHVSIYCWALTLAVLFDDPIELSRALTEVAGYEAISPLIRPGQGE